MGVYDSLLGKIIGGCHLKSILGRGGMGVVYAAQQLKLGREVAIKILLPDMATGENVEELIRYFQKETLLAARIQHPNVIQIYDVGQEDDVYFVVMQQIKGNDLKTLLEQQQDFTVEQCLGIAKEVTRALIAAHEQDVIHRDIKPANIIIHKNGGIIVTDFGLRRPEAFQHVKQKDIWGTINYIAPEQLEIKEMVGAKTDIYSLGATIYHLLTGRPPFLGDNFLEIMGKLLNEEPADIRTLCAEIPESLAQLIGKMLSRSQNSRPNAKELLQAIKQIEFAGRTGGIPLVVPKKQGTHILAPALLPGENKIVERVCQHLKLQQESYPCARRGCTHECSIEEARRKEVLLYNGKLWCKHCLWETLDNILADARIGKTETRSYADHWLGLKGINEFEADELPRIYCRFPLYKEKKGWDKMLQRVERSTILLAGVHNRNLIQIGAYHEIKEYAMAYMTMEYIPGVWLNHLIDRIHFYKSNLDLDECIVILRKLAQAISALHDHNIVHRNITPHSIHISLSGGIRLGNFNVAKQTPGNPQQSDYGPVEFQEYCMEYWIDPDENKPPASHITTNMKSILGTLSYMSPEQTMGAAMVDCRSDLWSWGTVAYELLSGKKLFATENSWATVQEIRKGVIPSLPNEIPFLLCKIVDKALQRTIEKRYQSADEILQDLDLIGQKC